MRESMKECFTAQEIAEGKPRKIANNTWRYYKADPCSHDLEIIRLHHTDIIVKDRQGKVTLYSGGYRTVTTKDRINRFSPYRVWSKRGAWFVDRIGADQTPVPFYDGIVLPDAFEKRGAGNRALGQEVKLRSQIKRMLDKLAKAEHMPQPSSGDCLFCQALAGAEQVRGKVHRAERVNGELVITVTQRQDRSSELDPHGCVREHLKDCYLHGSLLARAVLARQYGSPAVVWHMRAGDWGRGKADMKRDLKRFLCQAVGLAA